VLLARGVEPRLVREVEATGVPFEWTSRVELAQLVGTTRHQGIAVELAQLVGTTRHQGIAALVEDLAYSDPEAPFRRAESLGELLLLVLLDGITDPQNYGAIIRSAEALGAHGVVSEERRSAPLSAATVKASAGAASRIPLVRVKNLPRYIEELKERGVWVYGLAGEAARSLEEADYRRPLALVIGSEGKGMRRLVREKCDELLRIPLRGRNCDLPRLAGKGGVGVDVVGLLVELIRARSPSTEEGPGSGRGARARRRVRRGRCSRGPFEGLASRSRWTGRETSTP